MESFKPANWAEGNSINEVLARFGEIDLGITADDLRAHIRDVLGRADHDEDAGRSAAGIVSNQFEDETLVGPYGEAIAGLSDTEKVCLLTMAARGSDIAISVSLDWTLAELTTLVRPEIPVSMSPPGPPSAPA